MLPRNTRQKRLCIARSHLFHVSLAFISLEHQLEAACKRYTCQAKRLALPAGSLFMDETSPRPKKRAERLNARFLRRLATRSFSSPEKSFLPPPLSVSFSLRGVGSTIFQLFHRAPPFHGISIPAIGNRPIFSSRDFFLSYENLISPIMDQRILVTRRETSQVSSSLSLPLDREDYTRVAKIESRSNP